ncbi:MAG: hypothetical protein QXY84_00030 [Candidatus Caldarchaeum sp.]
MIVLGSSTYAVMTACRFASLGYDVTLVNPSRRLGLFPFMVMPESFLQDTKLEKYEAKITKTSLNGRITNLVQPLYVLMSTLSLEKILSEHDVKYTTKMTKENDRIVDCSGKALHGLNVYQTLELNDTAEENVLHAWLTPGSSLVVDVFFRGLCFRTVYTLTKATYHRNQLAFVRRPSAYIDHETQTIFNPISYIGPDFAEFYLNNRRVASDAGKILQAIMTQNEEPKMGELTFLSFP